MSRDVTPHHSSRSPCKQTKADSRFRWGRSESRFLPPISTLSALPPLSDPARYKANLFTSTRDQIGSRWPCAPITGPMVRSRLMSGRPVEKTLQPPPPPSRNSVSRFGDGGKGVTINTAVHHIQIYSGGRAMISVTQMAGWLAIVNNESAPCHG
jgi:hypothetical protein